MSLTFQAMWRHRSRDHSINNRPFPNCFFRHIFGKTHHLATLEMSDRLTQHWSISTTIFIQLSPTLMKLCKTTHRIFYISLELNFKVCLLRKYRHCWCHNHIQHVCWHYKSSRSGITWNIQRSTKLWTTFANFWTRAFRPLLDILGILCELHCVPKKHVTTFCTITLTIGVRLQ